MCEAATELDTGEYAGGMQGCTPTPTFTECFPPYPRPFPASVFWEINFHRHSSRAPRFLLHLQRQYHLSPSFFDEKDGQTKPLELASTRRNRQQKNCIRELWQALVCHIIDIKRLRKRNILTINAPRSAAASAVFTRQFPPLSLDLVREVVRSVISPVRSQSAVRTESPAVNGGASAPWTPDDASSGVGSAARAILLHRSNMYGRRELATASNASANGFAILPPTYIRFEPVLSMGSAPFPPIPPRAIPIFSTDSVPTSMPETSASGYRPSHLAQWNQLSDMSNPRQSNPSVWATAKALPVARPPF